jgi:DNA-binding transcriptional LysR family regulator
MTSLVGTLYRRGISVLHVELRQLRYFVAVAEELSFSRAARKLHIAQPPLSRQIKQLEQELGFPLFLRSTRQIALTEAGARYLAEIRTIFGTLEAARRAAHALAVRPDWELQIGHIPSLTVPFLPPLIAELRNEFPQAAIGLTELSYEEQIEAILARQIDLGLFASEEFPAGFSHTVVFSSPRGVLLPANHRAVGESGVSLAGLSDEEFICISVRGSRGHQEVTIEVCREVGFTPKITHFASSPDDLVNLVGAGFGVSVLPALGTPRLMVPGVAFRPIREPLRDFEIYAVWDPARLNPVATRLLELLKEPRGSTAEKLIAFEPLALQRASTSGSRPGN